MNDFRNEVELLGKLRHPTVVAMMAYCIDAPDLLLMMEYMEVGRLFSPHSIYILNDMVAM